MKQITLKLIIIKSIVIAVLYLLGFIFMPNAIFYNVVNSPYTYIIILFVALAISYLLADALEATLNESVELQGEYFKDRNQYEEAYIKLKAQSLSEKDWYKLNEKIKLYDDCIGNIKNYSIKEIAKVDEEYILDYINQLKKDLSEIK